MSLDQFSVYGDLVPPDGSPAPGCNLNGPYRLRITLNGLDTDITWREQILDGSGSPQQEIPDTANHVEITYNLNAPGGALVLVTALIVPKGDYAQCPITPLTVSFGGCGDVNCEDYGYYESSTPGECQRCPDGQIWDTVNETCVDEPTEPIEPIEPIEPKSKFCKCKHWWCYLLGVGLSILIGIYILGAFNCLVSNAGELTNTILQAIQGMTSAVTIIDTIGIGTAIILFWRGCGSCCTACAIWLGLIIGLILVIIQSIYQSSLPPCTWPTGIIVFAGLILIAITYQTRCGDE
jgi:hypothetical protein